MNISNRVPMYCALYLGIALAGLGFTLKPMSATLDPKGLGASKTFRVDNTSSNRVAFQITMVSREMDTAGKETLEPATNQFSIFPPQGFLNPGQSQTIRVIWKGPANLTNELAYRIVAEELPVNFAPEQGQTQIRMLLKYQGAVYVRPKSAQPSLRAASFNKTETNLWQLTISNTGSAHQNLLNPKLTLSDSTGLKTLVSTQDLQSIAGENILPQHTRNFLIHLPAEFTQPSYQAEIRADE